MSRAAINQSIWFLGLLLQILLLYLVVRRRIHRRFPLFAILLAFYPLRSLLLQLLAHLLAPTTYASTYNALSLIDILLQFLVALEIGRQILRSSSDGRWPRLLLLLALAATAGIATALVAQFMPAKAPIPADRLQIFDSLLMILTFAWSLILPFRRTLSALFRQIAAGLAVTAVVGLLATVQRTQAAIHRDPNAFSFWAYTNSATYLAVVLYWIFRLRIPTSILRNTGSGRPTPGQRP